MPSTATSQLPEPVPPLPGGVPLHGAAAFLLEPATGKRLGELRLASVADVGVAVDAAVAAQTAWAQLPFDQRARVMREAARLLLQRADEINRWNVRECGSTLPKAEWELNASYEQLHLAAGLVALPSGYVLPSVVPGRLNLCTRVPIGVVGVIAPWNYPVLLAMRSVAPALALGNAVLLKPALQGSMCGGLLLEEIFRDAGVPEGVFRVLPGEAEVGDAIVRHPGVGMVSFTGSTVVGRRIGEVCGGLLKKVALELGGNNAFVVMEDADIELAASNGAWGAFLHQGQICMQAGRHIVHESVAQAYGAALARRAAALSVGNPDTDAVAMGPLINTQQLRRLDGLVQDAMRQGATLLTGGSASDLFYPATVMTNVRPDMSVFTEELFGPVAPIVTYRDEDELVRLVNASSYGLSAAIHTGNPARGLALAAKLKTAMIHINDQTVNAEFNVPFGGMGSSGNGGRFGGPANVEEFTQSQWVSMVDKPIQYPF